MPDYCNSLTVLHWLREDVMLVAAVNELERCWFTESANSGENIYAMMKTSMPAGMPAVCYVVFMYVCVMHYCYITAEQC